MGGPPGNLQHPPPLDYFAGSGQHLSSCVLEVPESLVLGRRFVSAVRLNTEFWNSSESQGWGCKALYQRNTSSPTPACRPQTALALIWSKGVTAKPRSIQASEGLNRWLGTEQSGLCHTWAGNTQRSTHEAEWNALFLPLITSNDFSLILCPTSSYQRGSKLTPWNGSMTKHKIKKT